MLIRRLSWTVRTTVRIHGSPFICKRYLQGPGDKWMNLRNKKFPTDMALQHFDSFYKNVYESKWLSIRIAMHWPNKYTALVNPFGKDPDEIAASFAVKGASDLSHFYAKYRKHYERQKLRKKLLEEKRESKRAEIAAERGMTPEEVESDIEVSDISDSELGGVLSAASDPENILEMFQTDIEAMRDKEGFMENMPTSIDFNDFIPSSEMKYDEEVIDRDTYYRFYNPECEIDVETIEAPPIEIPESPKMFSFPRESLQSFEPPKHSEGLVDYLLLDAAAVLPVLALGIQPGDRVADLCAAPGGKALLILSTLRPGFFFACDPSSSRFSILKQKFQEFIPRIKSLDSTYHLENCSIQDIDLESVFDKIIIDAPSINDRLAISDNHENYFSYANTKKRLELPSLQKDILIKGLKLLKPGGSLVYTTNTLSPIQNDGVVHMSLYELSQISDMVFNVLDLREAFRPLRGLYRFHTFRYGLQVLPYIINNTGPVYFCKINRLK